MRTLYRLGVIGTTSVRVHYSWLIAIIVGYVALQTQVVHVYLPEASGFVQMLVTGVAVLLSIAVVVAHEAGHLLVARLCRIHLGPLNLYPLGGVTRLTFAGTSRRAMLLVAIAGPLTSLVLWWLLNMLASSGSLPLWLAVPLYAAGQISFFLGLINLLPGLPLDGGRIARAMLLTSGISTSFDRATRSAERLGQLVAVGFVLWGALALRAPDTWPQALALILVGWAIHEAGGGLHRRALVAQLFHRLTVGDLARNPQRTIGPGATLRSYATGHSARRRDAATPVLTNGVFLGLINRELLRRVPQGYWDEQTVAEAMLPAARAQPLAPNTPLMQALPRLLAANKERGNEIAVVAGDRLIGMIDAEEIRELLELEDEFGIVEQAASASSTKTTSMELVRSTRTT